MTENRFRISVLLVYVVLIFIASSIPTLTPPGPKFLGFRDKIAHFIEYGILGALLFKGIGWQVSRSRLITFVFVVAVGTSVGALDELYQSFVPGREMDVGDWIADTMGTITGAGAFIFTPLSRVRLTPDWVRLERDERQE